MEQIVYRLIEKRRQSGEDRGDLLSMLLQVRDEAGQPMPERQVRDEVMTLLLAGHETTALTLSWIWYLLPRHPEAEARLLVKLDTVPGGRAHHGRSQSPALYRSCGAVNLTAVSPRLGQESGSRQCLRDRRLSDPRRGDDLYHSVGTAW